ncbi:cytosol aminopeptidase-like isoform X3 [Neocloeon triangulifer]|uniref:cytosol aminopeptidase-like isoform X3 n=1 Tax=Neocloeon triangulifer TaxID=2078957 RepID=UPI00286EC7D2|nr:cytosol aminopeptidase-like isoform X3 [Neocloeon triangulifer]
MAQKLLILRSSARAFGVTSARSFGTSTQLKQKSGLVLGLYAEDESGQSILTPAGKRFDQSVDGQLSKLIQSSGPVLKKGKTRVFFGLPGYSAVAVAGLGKKGLGYNDQENINEGLEAAAEGANLGVWKYQGPKSKKAKPLPVIEPFEKSGTNWSNGVAKADAQNFARRLMDTPANLMTPTIFAQEAASVLSKVNVEVEIHDQKWAEEKKMGSFLSVTRGSDEPPRFLEMSYFGASNSLSKPVVLVGKGVTFDTGGISLKPPGKMDEMRADMGGAACVVATLKAAATLKIPINIKGLVPLCENMPSGRATKPGDVVTAMNGKTIQIDNTDAEGRLILADALWYAAQSPNRVIVDMATLTGAMTVCLGQAAAGVFSNSNEMWEELQKASCQTGDRVWRFPLWNFYTKQISEIPGADLNNIGKGPGGGSCTAAAFLKEFVGDSVWMHLDIASVMSSSGSEVPYISKGMAGRPVRTLIQFLAQLGGSK